MLEPSEGLPDHAREFTTRRIMQSDDSKPPGPSYRARRNAEEERERIALLSAEFSEKFPGGASDNPSVFDSRTQSQGSGPREYLP